MAKKFLPFFAGLLASQGFAQSYIWPLLLGGLAYLAFSLYGASSWKQAFWRAYGFGFGLFLVSMAWITHALFIDIHKFWPLVVPAFLGFPLVLAFFTGFSGAVTWGIHQILASPRIFPLAFALSWVGGEWLRGHLFTGLPWNLVGYGFMVSDTLAQGAALMGVYGLSFLGAFLAASLAFVWHHRYANALIALILLGVQTFYGHHRLAHADPTPTAIRLRIVQGNIPQKDKWNPQLLQENLDHYLTLTTQDMPSPPHIILWPEMAVPFDLGREQELRHRLAQAIPPGGYLLTGAPHFYHNPLTGKRQVGNSLTVLDDEGTITEVYDKVHLVPFGEYVPFRAFLQKWFSIHKITPGTTDFTPGPQLTTLKLGDLPDLAPLVCYEAIFPHAVIAPDAPRPQWMVNITNDGWYGDTDGPRQHLDMVRMRAIEEGMPLVRVASTGISAVVDAYGRIQGQLALNTAGVLDMALPRALGPQGFRTLF